MHSPESAAWRDARSLDAFIEEIKPGPRREDAIALIALIKEATSLQPVIWNARTIGYGTYHYRYASGQEGDFFQVGFSPGKQELTIYVMSGLRGFEDILKRLGKHRSSKSCVYIRHLTDVDRDVLAELVTECVSHLDAVEKSLGSIPRMSDIPPRVPPARKSGADAG